MAHNFCDFMKIFQCIKNLSKSMNNSLLDSLEMREVKVSYLLQEAHFLR